MVSSSCTSMQEAAAGAGSTAAGSSTDQGETLPLDGQDPFTAPLETWETGNEGDEGEGGEEEDMEVDDCEEIDIVEDHEQKMELYTALAKKDPKTEAKHDKDEPENLEVNTSSKPLRNPSSQPAHPTSELPPAQPDSVPAICSSGEENATGSKGTYKGRYIVCVCMQARHAYSAHAHTHLHVHTCMHHNGIVLVRIGLGTFYVSFSSTRRPLFCQPALNMCRTTSL